MTNLFGIPYEGRVNFTRGAFLGPAHTRFWLESLEDFSPYQGKDLEYSELGDLYPPSGLSGEEFTAWCAEALNSWAVEPPFLALGGDHTITLPLCLYLREKLGGFTVLYLDAHLDARDEFQGERFCHATVGKRLSDEGFEVLALGWRSLAPGEEGPNENAVFERLSSLKKCYLSLDLDVLDPSVFPGVSNPEPGGMSFGELIGLIQGLRGKIISADMVEYNPREDPGPASGGIAATIAREVLISLSR
ncbi:MAG: arginase family protein [candidate division WOR-3 bacterium]